MISKTRRRLLGSGLLLGLGTPFVVPLAAGASSAGVLTRSIPSSGEQIPAIGMGTWITFNVGNSTALRAERCEVLDTFFRLGGRMVDSSPMYGSAEEVVGHCTAQLDTPTGYLPTTKVWSGDRDTGRRQIEDSFRLFGVDQIDVLQIHNLAGWRTHLPYLRELKEQGRIRYIGITTSHGRRHQALAEIMGSEPLDFVQFTYNLEDREAERELLPLAASQGIGVIVNRPFRRGALFDQLSQAPLPGWAPELGCTNMAQVMLKFIISHPAVTCAIPATSKVDHMRQNMAAMNGEMPDPAMRRIMTDWYDGL